MNQTGAVNELIIKKAERRLDRLHSRAVVRVSSKWRRAYLSSMATGNQDENGSRRDGWSQGMLVLRKRFLVGLQLSGFIFSWIELGLQLVRTE